LHFELFLLGVAGTTQISMRPGVLRMVSEVGVRTNILRDRIKRRDNDLEHDSARVENSIRHGGIAGKSWTFCDFIEKKSISVPAFFIIWSDGRQRPI